jgi:hypothetical protein
MAGGYIKNAVLVAVNIALARATGDRVEVRQDDLVRAAGLQERHIGGGTKHRKIVRPSITLSDCPIDVEAREALKNLVRIARNYRRIQLQWFGTEGLHGDLRGLKIGIETQSPDLGIQTAEAIASEIGVPAAIVRLHDLLLWKEESGNDARREPSRNSMIDIFSMSEGSGLLLALIDHGMGCDHEKVNILDREFRELRRAFRCYDGIALFVGSAAGFRTLAGEPIFHEMLLLSPHGRTMGSTYWKKAVGTGIPMAEGITPDVLADRYQLGYDDIQLVLQKASLLLSARLGEAILDFAVLDEAVEWLTSSRKHATPLFGPQM